MASQTAPASANSFAAAKAAAMKVVAYNAKLRQENPLQSIFTKLASAVEYKDTGIQVPNDIVMKLEKPVKGTSSIVIGLKMLLQGAPTYNSTALIGNEENYRLKYMKVYFGLIRKAVSTEQYGITANDASAYNLYGEVQPDLSLYFGELLDYRFQKALVLKYADEIVDLGLSGVAHRFNPNIVIPTETAAVAVSGFDTVNPTETAGTWPAADSFVDGTSGEFIELIEAALSTASESYAAPENLDLNVAKLLSVEVWAKQTAKMEPLMVGGKPTFLLALPTGAMAKLLSPTSGSPNSVGNIRKDAASLTGDELVIPNAQFRVGMFLVTENLRNPTLTISGTGESAAAAVGFMCPGNNDGRNATAYDSASNRVFDLGFILGKGCLINWVVQPLKFATELYDYEMVKGFGAYEMGGVQMVEFNDDDNTGAKNFQRNSAVLILNRPTSY
jgi:hypothetical protein